MPPDPTARPPSAVLRTSKGWLAFADRVTSLRAASPTDVVPLLREAAHLQAQGLHVVLALAYEAAPAFDSAFPAPSAGGAPPASLVAFRRADPFRLPRPAASGTLRWEEDTSAARYATAIDRIKEWIARGDTYQVNFTLRLLADAGASPWDVFLHMAHAQHPRYGAWIDLDDTVICSASPELFFDKAGDLITCRPMKGTARRGSDYESDLAAAAALRRSEKNRAENLMIVDMVRNDLGRIARSGSVATRSLFDVHALPTVWQMTSTVEARSDAPLETILAALFPSASVTGAPKIRTMQLIRDLESSPRGIYTGAIGHLAPDGSMQFNVAIRTAVFDTSAQRWTYGVGSGIVWDSVADDEYAECMNKALLLQREASQLRLFETLLWRPGDGYWLLDGHLRRLAASAGALGFASAETAWRSALEQASAAWTAPMRVRFSLSREGGTEIDAAPAPAAPTKPWRVALAREAVDATDERLFHKTTDRSIYATARAGRPDADDVLLWNNDGELTESTIANVAVRIDGVLWTPPVRCGLLPGVLREELLARGEIRERVIPVADLRRAEEIVLFNSLRGWIPAVLVS